LRSLIACRRFASIRSFPNTRACRVCWALLLASVSTGLPLSAHAQQETAKPDLPKPKEDAPSRPRVAPPPPLPPIRPPSLTPPPAPQPASKTPTAPASEPSIPDFTNPALRPTVPATPQTTAPVSSDMLPAPQALPPASRQRMHQCGEEWTKMKASGAAADQTWRDFAMVCLAKP